MSKNLNILIVEDRVEDAELAVYELGKHGYDVAWKRVEDEKAFLEALDSAPDVIIADYSLPQFGALQALELLQSKGLDIPFLVITGALGDEAAVDCLARGASDFLLKDRLARLGQAVTNALKARDLRQEKESALLALKAAERKFRDIFENAAEAIFQFDTEGRILTANPAAAEMFGYSGSGDLFQKVQDVRKDLFLGKIAFNDLLARIGDGRHMKAEETQLRHGTGRLIWVSMSTRLVRNPDTQTSYYESIAQNINERKEAQAHVKEQAELLDLTSDAIIVRDMEEKVVFWNKGAETLYRIPASTALGKVLTYDLYEDRLSVINAKEVLLKKGAWSGELQYVHPENEPHYVASRWTLVREDSGLPKSILTIESAITEHRALEKQFLRAQRMESIGTLASGIAHDLNNVLTPILASASILKAKPSEKMLERTIKTIETSTRRGADIIKQVLTFARGIDGDRKILSIKPIITEVVKMAQKTFPKTVEIDLELNNTVWLFSGDQTQIEQVILNLCINARDAVSDRGRISVRAFNTKLSARELLLYPNVAPGPFICFEVEDTGPGIPREILDKIFDPFFTTKQPGSGTGLGLATIVGILKSHGGFIQVASEVGEGARFQVFLPAIVSAEAEEAEEVTLKIKEGSGEMVLVVDDEQTVLDITKTILEGSGYETITSRDGKEALEIYKSLSGSIHMVMTDLMMPVMGGTDLIRELKSISPDLDIMAFSGAISENSSSSHLAEIRNLGVKTFLQKPFTAESLLKTIHETME